MSLQYAPFQDGALDSLLELGQRLAEQVEKITRIQFDTGVASSREALAATQALLEVKDPEGLAEWQTAYFQPNLTRASEGVRQQYAVLKETRDILSDAVKQSTADATEQVRVNIDRLAEGAPDGMAPLFDMIRQSLAQQSAVLESFGKVADQFGEIVEANLQVANDAAAPAVKSRSTTKRKTS